MLNIVVRMIGEDKVIMMGDMADWINEQGEMSDALDPCSSCPHQDVCREGQIPDDCNLEERS